MCVTLHVCETGLCREVRGDFVESVFFLLCVDTEDRPQAIRLAWQVSYQCRHLGSPWTVL